MQKNAKMQKKCKKMQKNAKKRGGAKNATSKEIPLITPDVALKKSLQAGLKIL